MYFALVLILLFNVYKMLTSPIISTKIMNLYNKKQHQMNSSFNVKYSKHKTNLHLH